jgi:thiosulfate/3-mercaptopyruvate sulfurtransferase
MPWACEKIRKVGFISHRSWAVASVLLVTAAIAVSRPLAVAHDQQTEAAKDPWNESDTLAPSDLAKMLESDKKPSIAYIGPRVLYRAGRIPGARLHGPTSEADGLADLKRWASELPRSESLVIYCGCCPMEKCPNIRPAFKALREMGFTRLRVLFLATSFQKDWVERGFAVNQ